MSLASLPLHFSCLPKVFSHSSIQWILLSTPQISNIVLGIVGTRLKETQPPALEELTIGKREPSRETNMQNVKCLVGYMICLWRLGRGGHMRWRDWFCSYWSKHVIALGPPVFVKCLTTSYVSLPPLQLLVQASHYGENSVNICWWYWWFFLTSRTLERVSAVPWI